MPDGRAGVRAGAEEGATSEGHGGPNNVRAFLDIGTNSVRLVVVRVAPNHTYTLLVQEKEMVRLGENEYIDGFLQADAMQRAASACAGFVDLARNQGATEIVAVATSATREARNRRDFIDMLRKTAGIEVHTISGLEEARLIHLGVSSGMSLNDQTVLFVDIGGGSTEIIVGNQFEHFELESLKLGAIRLTSLFFLPDEDGPVADDRYALLQRYVRNAAIRALPRLGERPIDMAVGSSGTIENLADIAARRLLGRARNRDDVLTLAQLGEIVAELRRLPLSERKKVPGIGPGRADLIVAGAAILETLLADLGVDEIRISDRGLREGLIIDHMAREQPDMLRAMSVRDRSVLGLGRACRFDEQHGRTVTRLALALFDGTRAAGMHDLGAEERELLAHAAMLHDIGTFLSSTSHQRHTHYLISNADLLGFDMEEIALIAAIARFHRKGFPSKKHPVYRNLSGASRRIVRPLAACLRLAESLDRNRAGLVHRLEIGSETADAAELALFAESEPQLELWGAESNARAFERAFGRRLSVRWVPEPAARPTAQAVTSIPE